MKVAWVLAIRLLLLILGLILVCNGLSTFFGQSPQIFSHFSASPEISRSASGVVIGVQDSLPFTESLQGNIITWQYLIAGLVLIFSEEALDGVDHIFRNLVSYLSYLTIPYTITRKRIFHR